MEIRKADSKGRVTVGVDGVTYWVTSHDDGSLTLTPVEIPDVPEMPKNALHAVYWDPTSGSSQPDRVYVNSVLVGDMVDRAKWVAELANRLGLPVVVREVGVGAVAADYLASKELLIGGVIKIR